MIFLCLDCFSPYFSLLPVHFCSKWSQYKKKHGDFFFGTPRNRKLLHFFFGKYVLQFLNTKKQRFLKTPKSQRTSPKTKHVNDSDESCLRPELERSGCNSTCQFLKDHGLSSLFRGLKFEAIPTKRTMDGFWICKKFNQLPVFFWFGIKTFLVPFPWYPLHFWEGINHEMSL